MRGRGDGPTQFSWLAPGIKLNASIHCKKKCSTESAGRITKSTLVSCEWHALQAENRSIRSHSVVPCSKNRRHIGRLLPSIDSRAVIRTTHRKTKFFFQNTSPKCEKWYSVTQINIQCPGNKWPHFGRGRGVLIKWLWATRALLVDGYKRDRNNR